MSFHPITIGPNTFNSTGPGKYTNSTVVFGGPLDELKISPGSITKSGVINASVSRHRQKDIVVNGVTTRKRASVIVQIQADSGFTAEEIDWLLSDLAEFATVPVLDRIMLGDA